MNLILAVKVAGLLFNIAGGIIYYYYGILKKAPYPYKPGVVIQYKDEMLKQKRYKRGLFYSKLGFAILLAGFVLQLAALLIESGILKI